MEKFKLTIIHIVLLAGCVLFSSGISAQHLSQKEAVEDLEFLKMQISTFNPALLIYNPDFEVSTGKIISEIQEDSISLFSYFEAVSRMCALSNEGHFHLGDWNDIVHKGIPGNIYRYLPLSVKIAGGKIYVWEDYSDERKLNRGEEIISINEKNSDAILRQLYQTTPSDGNIITYASENIENGFPWMYYFYVEQCDEFRITCQGSDQSEKEVSIKALIRSQQAENYRKYFPKKEAEEPYSHKLFDLNYEDNTAYLKLKSFDYQIIKQYKIKSKRFYRNMFKGFQEKGIRNLVIDLRNNTGGRIEMAYDMIPFFLKQDNGDNFLKKTISWEGKERVYQIPEKSKYAFKGQIYVLTNGRTYSTGSTLARYLREYGNAITIGQETGTRYEGFAAGSTQYIILPHTQIRIGIPRYHILLPASQKQKTTNQGLIPDYPISYTIQDIMAESDLELEKVRALMGAHDKQSEKP